MSKIAPSEPAPAPPKGYRPHMPMKVKLEAALLHQGLSTANTDFDHCPPLAMRPWDPEKQDTIPAANDPAFIVPRAREEHRAKTSGGKTKARAQGDVTEISRTKNMANTQQEFRDRILAKEPGKRPERKSKWGSRPFRKKERSK